MSHQTRRSNGLAFHWIVPAIFIGLPLIGRPLILYATQDTVQFTALKLERVANRFEEGAKYMVFTPNETFENTDVLIFGKLNSSDLYGNMKEGATYKADVAGLRIPLLNWHRNIIRVQEVVPSKSSTSSSPSSP
jgi:hypothetical protein